MNYLMISFFSPMMISLTSKDKQTIKQRKGEKSDISDKIKRKIEFIKSI